MSNIASAILYSAIVTFVTCSSDDIVIQTNKGLRQLLYIQKRSSSVIFGPESVYPAPNGLLCHVCPPGFYKKSDCTTNNTIAACEGCPVGQYSRTYNIASRCAICSIHCIDKNGIVEHPCNSTSDMMCRCKDGYYNHSKGSGEWICLPHSKCGPGFEANETGTSEYDTVCKVCKTGTFSSTESSTEKCLPCSKCPNNHIVKEHCDRIKDVVCTPKDESLILSVVIPAVVVVVGVGGALVILLVCLQRKGFITLTCCMKGGGSLESCDGENSTVKVKNPLFMVETGMLYPPVIDVPIDKKEDPPTNDTNRFHQPEDKKQQKSWCNLFRFISEKISLKNEQDDSVWIEFIRILFDNTHPEVREKNNKIDQIRIDYQNDGVREQLYRCLSAWEQKAGDRACVSHVINTLRAVHQNDLATEIENRFQELFNEQTPN